MQMFEVAFSRRMCCSRVCSASRYAGWRRKIDRDADEAAGHLPLEALTDRHVAGVRTPKPIGTPNR